MITKSCTVYECLRLCGYTMTHYQLTEKYENDNERYIERNTEEKGAVGYDDSVLSSIDISKGSYVRTTGLHWILTQYTQNISIRTAYQHHVCHCGLMFQL